MTADHLSTTFSALADPTRRAILSRLALGQTSVLELARPFEMSLPRSRSISKFWNTRAHYRGREAQWRPCKLKPESLKAVDGWLEHYRHFWDEPLDRLEDYLRDIQAKGKKEEKNGNGKK